MDRQYGIADFFAMEAGEYLERLDALVSAAGPPNGEDLQRLTRALRGAALMANQQPIAAAAGSFEHLARAVREGRHAWDEGTQQLAIRTVDDLKVFVRHARDWSDADTARARELAATLERAGGRAVTSPRNWPELESRIIARYTSSLTEWSIASKAGKCSSIAFWTEGETCSHCCSKGS